MEKYQQEMLRARSRFTTLVSSLLLLAVDAAEMGYKELSSDMERLANEIIPIYMDFNDSFEMVVPEALEDLGLIESGKLLEVLRAMMDDGLIEQSGKGKYRVRGK
ncbi:MAG: hypothetical protein GTO14_13660 [Anaerolineales bacterium]|nr:hypothetical protein [Anaerolineales bacterium]